MLKSLLSQSLKYHRNQYCVSIFMDILNRGLMSYTKSSINLNKLFSLWALCIESFSLISSLQII